LAEQHLRTALQADATRDDARLLLAEVLESRAAQGDDTLGEAAELYSSYLEKYPNTRDSNALRVRLGQIYARQQRHQQAIEQWESAREAGESGSELERLLLDAYLQAQPPRKDNASALLDEILVRDGSDPELWLLAGRLRMEKREYQAAAERFLRAAQLRPDFAEAHINLASALFLMKEYEPTLRVLAKVAELGQDTPGTHFLRAVSHDHLRHQEEALVGYERFLALADGKNPDQEFQARQRARILSNELRRRGRGRR
jgi:tetratricopeptide (TPR) repeat protein